MIKTVICFAYFIVLALALLPFAVLSWLIGLAGLRRPMSAMVYRLAQAFAAGLVAITGCRVAVSGRERIPRSGGTCFVANHASIFDIVLLLRFAGRPFGFIAKRELAFVPLLNVWIALLGGLFIDRRNPRRALATIGGGAARIRRGGGMLIFPEGSRSRGQGLLPFRPGALKLATQSEAVIVPVALAGTYDVFERGGRLASVPVSMTFCEPIRVADIPAEDRKAALAERVREAIAGELGNR